MVGTPKMYNNSTELSGLVGVGVLNYDNSTTPPSGLFQLGPIHLIWDSPSVKLNPLGNIFTTLIILHNINK